MQVYETVLIYKPVLSDPEVAEQVEKTKQAIAADGGEMVNNEIWGRRKLTHMIGKSREGVYAWFKYKGSSKLLDKLNHTFAISDILLRNLTVLAQDRKMREKKSKPKAKAPAPAAAAQE